MPLPVEQEFCSCYVNLESSKPARKKSFKSKQLPDEFYHDHNTV